LSFASHGHHHGLGPYWPLSFFSGDQYWGDQYWGDQYGANYSGMAAPPVILLQAAAAQPDDQPAPSIEPLLIELKGDRYVQVGQNAAESEEVNTQPNYPQGPAGANGNGSRLKSQPDGITNVPLAAGHVLRKQTGTGARNASAAVNAKGTSARGLPPAVVVYSDALPPAVVVYRDGHREDVSEYAIVDGMLYASGNYYADGYWNKKIELSSLNLPETVKSNQERGIKFTLPGAPNEVVTRP